MTLQDAQALKHSARILLVQSAGKPRPALFIDLVGNTSAHIEVPDRPTNITVELTTIETRGKC